MLKERYVEAKREGPIVCADGDVGGGGVLLLMPTTDSTTAGPVSTWITAAGWAQATRELHGESWLRTPHGVLAPDEARARASRPSERGGRPRWRQSIPTFLGTARKDARQWRAARQFRDAGIHGPWSDGRLDYVWQHHELFHDSGFVAARRHSCPVVLFVDAPIVWEAGQWGIRRPLWGPLAERFGERPQLREADLVACVSSRVAEQVVDLGADPEHVIVTPCAADLDRFRPSRSSDIRRELDLDGRFVVGWLGTFHGFHGLDVLLDAVAILDTRVPDATLLLIGDGLDRRRVEARAVDLDLDTRFVGTVPHDAVPAYLAAMDVATIVDPGRTDFHYSPLKLKEYLACGLAVVAPRSGDIDTSVVDGQHAVLVPPGDPAAVAAAIVELHRSPDERVRMGLAGRALMEREGSWRAQAERVCRALHLDIQHIGPP